MAGKKHLKTFSPSMNYRYYFTSNDKKNKGKPNHQDFPCHYPHKRISSKREYISFTCRCCPPLDRSTWIDPVGSWHAPNCNNDRDRYQVCHPSIGRNCHSRDISFSLFIHVSCLLHVHDINCNFSFVVGDRSLGMIAMSVIKRKRQKGKWSNATQ